MRDIFYKAKNVSGMFNRIIEYKWITKASGLSIRSIDDKDEKEENFFNNLFNNRETRQSFISDFSSVTAATSESQV